MSPSFDAFRGSPRNSARGLKVPISGRVHPMKQPTGRNRRNVHTRALGERRRDTRARRSGEPSGPQEVRRPGSCASFSAGRLSDMQLKCTGSSAASSCEPAKFVRADYGIPVKKKEMAKLLTRALQTVLNQLCIPEWGCELFSSKLAATTAGLRRSLATIAYS